MGLSGVSPDPSSETVGLSVYSLITEIVNNNHQAHTTNPTEPMALYQELQHSCGFV